MFEYGAGGVTTSSREKLWSEAGLLSKDASVKRKGNLYMVSEGPASECGVALKAIRDQYYGDTAQPEDESSMTLRRSLESTNDILRKRSGIGISCVCATVSESGELSLFQAGDCYAYLLSDQEGAIYKLGDRHITDEALGRAAEPKLTWVKRALRDKDILVLCSGSLVDDLGEEEIASITSLYSADRPTEIAKHLVEKASLQRTGGIHTALVVMCRSGEVEVSTSLPIESGAEDRAESFADSGEVGTTQERMLVSDSPRTMFSSVGPIPLFAGTLAVLVAALFLARPFIPSTSDEATPTPSLPVAQASAANDQVPDATATAVSQPTPGITPADTPVASWANVDALWKKGEAGDVTAWQQTVALLEQLQSQTPDDTRIPERLSSARTNLIYLQHMQEAAAYWGSGETSASSTGNWAKAVESLEALLTAPLSTNQLATVKSRLYAAHINYGKALEAAKRLNEAKGQYQRALEIVPQGKEAVDALGRLPH